MTSVKFIGLWLWVAFALHAVAGSTDESDHSVGTVSVMGGIDYWHIQSPASNNPGNIKKLLHLPDTTSLWDYKNPSAWFRVNGAYELDSHLTVNYKFRSDQEFGNRVDDLSLDYSMSPSLGFRAGVLDYKTSWCKNYESDSPWIREPDIFCAVRGANVITGGAPGLQTYTNLEAGNYRIQTAIGIYNPMLLDYDRQEFSNVRDLDQTPAHVEKNRRYGASINMLNLQSGSELRLGYTLANQRGQGSVSREINNHVDVYYLGYVKPLTPSTTLTVTYAVFNPYQKYSFPDQYVARIADDRSTSTLELNHRQSVRDVFVLGISKHDIRQKYNDSKGLDEPNYIKFDYFNYSIAWRHQMSDRLFMVFQNTWVHQENSWATGRRINPYLGYGSNGQAFGIRIGYTY